MVLLSCCSLDTDEPAPYLSAPTSFGQCPSTESLLPKLLGFIRSERMKPLETVIEKHLLPSEEQPQPDLPLRTVIGAAVSLVTSFGLEETADTAKVLATSSSLERLEEPIIAALKFTTGERDVRSHYEAADAGAHFVRECDADHLLGALQALAEYKSPQSGERLWLSVVVDALHDLVTDDFFAPFLETFERDSERGRPAIVALVAQIMGYLAAEDFQISRIETLLESVVYPIVNETLRNKIDRMVELLDEATQPEVAILAPLQRAMRCGMSSPPERDEFIGYIYDLVMSEELGIKKVRNA